MKVNLEESLSKTPLVPYMREGDFAVRRPWTVERRRLLDYLLFWVKEGECIVEADGREHRFVAGEWCFVQPRTLLRLSAPVNTVTPFSHFDLFFNPRREESFPAPPGLLDLASFEQLVQPRLDDFAGIEIPLRLQPSNAAWLRDTFLKAVGAWQNRDALSQIETQNRLADIALAILRDSAVESPAPSTAPLSLDWFTSYLMLHLAEPISIADMARRASLSPSRFAAAFRAHFGMPPHQYLLHLRIAHAQELLSNSDATLNEITRFCGFADIHHFAKVYKRHTSQTPGEFRKGVRRCSG